MTHSPLLGPIVALVAWTLVMLVWTAAVRVPLMRGRDIPDGARGADMPPGKHHWPSHNYTHLVEQPTLFYAIMLVLVAMGQNASINIWLAWGYVGLRIVHSLVQATINRVKIRFVLFLASTLCLVGLTVHAGAGLLHG